MKVRSLPSILLVLLAVFAGPSLGHLFAEDAEAGPGDRVQLMASALRLRDQGEFAEAYKQVVKLERLAPEDRSVLQLKRQLEEKMGAQGIVFEPIQTQPESGDGSMEVTTGELIVEEDAADDTAMVMEEEVMTTAPVTGEVSLARARQLKDAGRYSEAIAVLSQLRETAPPAEQSQIDSMVSDILLAQEVRDQEANMESSREDLRQARKLANEGNFAGAFSLLTAAEDRLTPTKGTEGLIGEIQNTRREFYLEQADSLARQGRGQAAVQAFRRYEADPSPVASIQRRAREVEGDILSPFAQDIATINPEFVSRLNQVEDLLLKGRAQFVNGDMTGARDTFSLIESIDPENTVAKAFLREIAERSTRAGYIDYQKTREEMLNQVSRAWQQPRIYEEDVVVVDPGIDTANAVLKKLERIIIPRVTFQGTSLPRAVQSLSEMSEQFDPTQDEAERGVNMVVTAGTGSEQTVSFSVRNLSLLRILDIVAQQTNFQWDVVDGVVEFTPSDAKAGNNRLQRAIIPISKGTLDLILDIQTGGGGGGGTAQSDPFAPAAAVAGPAGGDRESSLRQFFEASGIDFEGVAGASIVARGSTLLINQTARNIEEIRRTLRELDVTDQVEIEAKFMEVAQGDLQELGFQWQIGQQDNLESVSRTTTRGTTDSDTIQRISAGNSSTNQTFNTTTSGPPVTTNFSDSLTQNSGSNSSTNRTRTSTYSASQTETITPQYDQFGDQSTALSQGLNTPTNTLRGLFGTGVAGLSSGVIQSIGSPPINFSVAPGQPANALDLGLAAGAGPVFSALGVIAGLDVSVLINALEREQTTDLLSSPRVTVMSGKTANIVVAQEFRYPESYGEPTLTASSGNSGSSVALASGVPEDFTVRNIGVELVVTPTVEPNDKINLSLTPTVTEFEGYVQYGGPNIAVTGGSTVQAPSGYFQPIFTVRKVETEVTVYDGATVVLGGLTREQIKGFKEKIPLLGDIPFIGRLFRNEGETSQKRNLIVFVTANLISPGGSPAKQNFENAGSNSLFQNPTVISPGGILSRDKLQTGQQ